jgi:RNA polymerase sigma-70 factor (ECF subfamily)
MMGIEEVTMADCHNVSDTDHLLQQVREGDEQARETLLERHRVRLRRMLTMRMDKRLATRVDPSDVVQEALKAAHGRLSEYLNDPHPTFYLWLRGIALDRLVELYRRHVVAGKRSVLREQPRGPVINDESEFELANYLVTQSLNPSRDLVMEELLTRVRNGLQQLSTNDREILELRHLEQLSVKEIAAVLGISKTAVTTRHLRALQRLRDILGTDDSRQIH